MVEKLQGQFARVARCVFVRFWSLKIVVVFIDNFVCLDLTRDEQ